MIRVSVDYHRSDIAGAENYFTRVLSNADPFILAFFAG